jgi:hypothetical protein
MQYLLFHRKVGWSRAKEAQEPLLMMIAAVKSRAHAILVFISGR